jgi:hypothetical protein
MTPASIPRAAGRRGRLPRHRARPRPQRHHRRTASDTKEPWGVPSVYAVRALTPSEASFARRRHPLSAFHRRLQGADRRGRGRRNHARHTPRRRRGRPAAGKETRRHRQHPAPDSCADRAIRVEHLEPRERGLRLTLPHSKGEVPAAVSTWPSRYPLQGTALCPGCARDWTPPRGRNGRNTPTPRRLRRHRCPAPPPASSRPAPPPSASIPQPWAGTASSAAR